MSGAVCVLKTGTGGSGKTSSAVAELLDLVESWGDDPALKRPIYVHGVRELTIEHFTLPVYSLARRGQPYKPDDRTGQPAEPVYVEWSEVPEGAHVLIDEAHLLFPPRALNAPVPAHVAWFATARHLGCTVVLMTQRATSIDIEVRARCGLHQHYVTAMGPLRYVREWADGVSTSGKSPDTARAWVVPRRVHGMYRSANLHTKGAASKLPVWLVVPVGAVLLGIWAVPSAYRALGGAMGGGGLAARPGVGASAPAAAAPPVLVAAASASPVAAASAPSPVAACMSMGERCECIDAAGFRVELPRSECVQSAREYGYRIPYPTRPPVGEVAASGVVLASAGQGSPDSAGAAVGRAMRDLGAVAVGGK